MNAYEREEARIEDSYDKGDISLAELKRELRELNMDYQAAAEEAAQGAYEAEMGRW